MIRTKTVLLSVLLILGFWVELAAQNDLGAIPDEQRRFLEVRRRQIELKSARSELERVLGLFEQNLVAGKQLELAQVAVDTAQLNYQQSVLTLLSLQPRISVQEAVKFQKRDGRRSICATPEKTGGSG